MLIDAEKLREEILAKYETQQAFAKKINYSVTTITRAIKTQSPKFMLACKKAGIDIDNLLREEKELASTDKEGRLVAAQRRIRELERLVEDQRELINYYKSIVTKK